MLVPNCPFYNVDAKLSVFFSWCQIVRLPSWCQNGPFLLPWCQIVQGQIVLPPAAADDDDDYDENHSQHEVFFPQKRYC